MPSWPTALGGMFLTGYAATQAPKMGIDSPTTFLASALKNLGDAGAGAASSARVPGSSEMTVLQGEVDRLHQLLSDVVRGQQKGPGYTVIHTGRGGSWTVYVVPAVIVGGVAYLYVRIRGLSVSDFFMVTNRSLQGFRDQVSASMTQLWEELRKHKDEFLSRFAVFGEQQQQLMAQQNEMGEQLHNVSSSVDEIRDISNTIEARVGQMDQTINLMNSGVQRANEGIYLLCATMAEVTRRVGMDTGRLKSYVQSTPPELTDSNPGLRTLLADFSSSGDQPVVSGTATITELLESGDGACGEVGSPAQTPVVGTSRSNSSRAGGLLGAASGDMGLMYTRGSGTLQSSASGRGFIGSWTGLGGGNRSRSVANVH
ncbi:hypothetical protein Agub_g15046 [Astrephomene gubernaculifera]|uniref:DUF1664 domain-containing protein n=1 Tax=Astrephomene gubernaculifera TaxID=47775 RepID=A0AAD3HTN7_9CHLO|nr:hypothetical protein Agub_g15046 [Astrephomene gubernaculifera]